MSITTKYQDLFRVVGTTFLPVFFDSQGLTGQRFLEHFEQLIVQRADEIGASVAPPKIYWSRRLSVMLQRRVARAINIRMETLYTGPIGPTAVDKNV